MKRIGSFLIGLIVFVLPTFVYASTTVYERDENNLHIWDSIKVTDSNIDNILATPRVDEKEKIYDFADLFSDVEEIELFALVDNYIKKYNMDMVVVTIDNNNKSSARIYAEDFYDYNYFGISDTYDGILYLIDMDTREIWFSTTGNAMLMYDDSRVDSVLDDAYNFVVGGNYYASAKSFVEGATYYASLGPSSIADDYYIDEYGDLIKKKSINLLVMVIGSIIIASVTVYIFISKHKGVKLATSAHDYINRENIKFGNKCDTFLTTHTSRTYIGSSSSSSGGGGISSSRGSSGRSHGGGGRRF